MNHTTHYYRLICEICNTIIHEGCGCFTGAEHDDYGICDSCNTEEGYD